MTSARRDEVITGANAIANRLGCCRRTVLREVARGRLPAFKTGDATSPLKIRASQLEAYIAKREA